MMRNAFVFTFVVPLALAKPLPAVADKWQENAYDLKYVECIRITDETSGESISDLKWQEAFDMCMKMQNVVQPEVQAVADPDYAIFSAFPADEYFAVEEVDGF